MIFKFQSAALKEAIDDLEWPGSSIQIMLQPVPPSVTFRGEGHGDLQVMVFTHLFIFNLTIKLLVCPDINIFSVLNPCLSSR